MDLLEDPKISKDKKAKQLLKTPEGVDAFLKEYAPPGWKDQLRDRPAPVAPPPGYVPGQKVATPGGEGSGSGS